MIREPDNAKLISDEVLDSLVLIRGCITRLVSINKEEKTNLSALIDEVLALHQNIMESIDMLWEHCQRQSIEHSLEQFSLSSKRVCYLFVDVYLDCIRRAEQYGVTLTAPREQLLTRAMHAVRWAAKWSWLRYEKLPEKLWMVAAYIFEYAERIHVVRQVNKLYQHLDLTTSVEQEYLASLFIDWVAPSSLTPLALGLLDKLASESLEGVILNTERTSIDEDILDLTTGRLSLSQTRKDALLDRPTRYVNLNRFIENLSNRLATVEGRWAANLSDAIALLKRSPAGRPSRYLVRMGHRTSVVRIAHIRSGYAHVLEAEKARITGRKMSGADEANTPDCRECVVRDVSANGCRLFVPTHSRVSLRVGSLVTLGCAQTGTVSVGVVRWLNRDKSENWEAGLWLLPGTISVFSGEVSPDKWSTGVTSESILIIDNAGIREDGSIAAVLPKKSYEMMNKIVISASSMVLEKVCLLESGFDFDLGLFQVEDLH